MNKRALSFTSTVCLVLVLTSFTGAPQATKRSTSNVVASSVNTMNESNPGFCSAENKTFQQGERITYKLFYKLKFIWVPAGEVVFSVTDNLDGSLHLSAEGQTYKSYEWFFKVRNSYQSDIDQQSLLPSHSLRKIKEGKHRSLYEKVIFDQSKKTASSNFGCSKEKADSMSIDVQDCMHDLLSVLYYTRNIDLKNQAIGSKFPINVFMDQQVHSLNIIYKGKENRKRIKGRGRFNTIHYSPESMPGELFDKKAKMDIWVSDDQNRIPLLIRTPLAGSQIKAVLKKHEGLRHELTSKVK